MKKKIYYLAHYDENLITRNVSPAAKAKIDYILNQISVDKYDIELISLANVKYGKNEKGKTKQSTKHKNVTIKTFSSRSHKIRLFRILNLLILQLKFFLYTLFKLKRNDTVIVYHSSLLMKHAKLLKFFKNLDIIYQIEEIYGYVNKNERMIKKEIKAFKMTNKYILSTNELIRYLEPTPDYIVINGPINLEKFNYNKNIHNKRCIYAGTLSENKGADLAIKAFKHLSNEYELHIIGFGTNEDISRINKLIEKSNHHYKTNIYFHGFKTGYALDKMYEESTVGLATQSINNEYNFSSFPSKVTTYLSYGLEVVSPKLEIIKSSNFNSLITYYDEENPQDVARAIKTASETRKNSFDCLENINKEISYKLEKFLDKGEKNGKK